jgi:glycerol-3-phosphate cytidylyltransferase-like family protein
MLYDKLRKLGFEYVTTPLSRTNKFLNLFRSPENKKTDVIHLDWVQKVINGKTYDVYECDIWYTQLRIDGVVVFDDRRFKDEDLLKLIPHEENIEK